MKEHSDSLKNMGKYYRREFYLTAAVLAAAVILGLVFWTGHGDSGEDTGGILEITIDGELYGNFRLDEEQEIVVASAYGSNTVVIGQGRAYVKEADCPDAICVGMKEIARDGEIICCLPHRLFLTVKGTESGEYDAVTY